MPNWLKKLMAGIVGGIAAGGAMSNIIDTLAKPVNSVLNSIENATEEATEEAAANAVQDTTATGAAEIGWAEEAEVVGEVVAEVLAPEVVIGLVVAAALLGGFLAASVVPSSPATDTGRQPGQEAQPGLQDMGEPDENPPTGDPPMTGTLPPDTGGSEPPGQFPDEETVRGDEAGHDDDHSEDKFRKPTRSRQRRSA
jgi:hypothetical protein